jgi:TetR/AcrR family transcriptional regulator, mexJK operon transcriptional repressor
MASPGATSPTTRSERKRHAIRSAGRQLFLAQGFQRTSVDQIAALAKVSKQTVYTHFEGKRELLLDIVSAALDAAVTPFLDKIAGLPRTNDIARDLTGLAVDYLHSVLAEPVVQLRRLIIGEANALPELAEAYYQQAPRRTLTALAEAFQRLAADGTLDINDPRTAAEHFAFLVIGHSIDEALFLGSAHTLQHLDITDHTHQAITVFLAAYPPQR